MATQVLTKARLFLDEFDLTGDMNAMALDYGAELQDDTVFGDDTRSRKGGLKTLSFTHEGYWSGGADNVDDVLFSKIGTANSVITIAPSSGGAGDDAYIVRGVYGDYSPGGAVGEMFSFSVSGEADDNLSRGLILLNSTATDGASTSFTAAQTVGAVAAGETLYGALHVVRADSTSVTLDVTVQSDASTSFASPSTRGSFSQITGKGSAWFTSTASSTDTELRLKLNPGSSGNSFTAVVTLAVL